jgi:ABC-type lipoprotein export system ATPase subunit
MYWVVLDTASSGQYYLNGIDVSHMTDNDLADIRNKQIGFRVPDVSNLFAA